VATRGRHLRNGGPETAETPPLLLVDSPIAPALPSSHPTSFILGGGVHGRLFLYDVFSGVIGDALWLDVVTGLSNARKRMEQIASTKPGRYFVFSQRSNSVMVQIDTRESTPSLRKAKSA
jgi:hypothetical protein